MRYVVDRDRNAHKFAIGNAAKDLRYINNMAAEVQVVNVMAAAARHYYAHVEAIGHADDYVPMLSDHVGALNGVNMEEEVRKGARHAATEIPIGGSGVPVDPGPERSGCRKSDGDSRQGQMNIAEEAANLSEVSCVAITVAKVGYQDRVREALEGLIAPVHKERGVIQYDLFQDPNEQRRFVFIERWETIEEFNAHCAAPHIKDYLKLTDGWLEYSAFYPLKRVP
jgi:quinol monooxygenase YgiN